MNSATITSLFAKIVAGRWRARVRKLAKNTPKNALMMVQATTAKNSMAITLT
jgi:hypothetical protein